MKKSLALAFAAFGFVVSGCGSSVQDTGVPKNVDMSKNYAPAAALPKMTPGDMAKGKAKAASAPKGEPGAPAGDAKAEAK